MCDSPRICWVAGWLPRPCVSCAEGQGAFSFICLLSLSTLMVPFIGASVCIAAQHRFGTPSPCMGPSSAYVWAASELGLTRLFVSCWLASHLLASTMWSCQIVAVANLIMMKVNILNMNGNNQLQLLQLCGSWGVETARRLLLVGVSASW